MTVMVEIRVGPAVMEAAGSVDVRFSERRWDAFSGSPSESSSAKFGTQGVAIYAVKPAQTKP